MGLFGPSWWHHHGQKFEYAKPEISEDGLRAHFQASAASFTLSMTEYPYCGYQVAPKLEYMVAQSWNRQTRELFHGTQGVIRWGGIGWITLMFGIADRFTNHPNASKELREFMDLYRGHSSSRVLAYPGDLQVLEGYESMTLSPDAFSHQHLFHRLGQMLNVPGPGTGHDGDPNISILVTPEIQDAVGTFCTNLLQVDGSVKQEVHTESH